MATYRIPVYYSTRANITSTGTYYLPGFSTTAAGAETTEANVQNKVRSTGTLENLRLYIDVNTLAATSTLVVRNGGVDGNSTISISAGATGYAEDVTNTDSFTSGDFISLKFTRATSGNIRFAHIGYDYITSTAIHTFGAYNVSTVAGTAASTSYYSPAFGEATAITTLTDVSRTYIPCAGTAKLMSFYVTQNTRSTNTIVKMQINGVDSGITYTVPASTAGFIEDTVNTATIAQGDIINFVRVNGTGSGSFNMSFFSLSIETTDETMNVFGFTIDQLSPGVTRYITSAAGTILENNEVEAEFKFYGDYTVDRLGGWTNTNTASNDATCTLRINSADGNSVFVVTGGSAGTAFNDTVNSDTVVSGDDVSIRMVRAAGSNNMNIRRHHFRLTLTDEAPPAASGNPYYAYAMQ